MSSDAFLETAAAIGRRIVAEAVWHDGRCSWVGAVAEPLKRSRPEYRPVGPLLYDGTAGVGLFLAQLAAATGEEVVRTTALGALRHAVERESTAAPHAGLHLGTLGVAWAAGLAAPRLASEEPAIGARSLADRVAPDGGADVRSGAAGTVVALLGLAVALDDAQLLDEAVMVGEGLIGVVRDRRPRGVADGTEGIGWALAELYAATGDARFLEAARVAFDHEDRTPDDPRIPRCAPVTAEHPTWCTGAAGTALSRHRAGELLGRNPECSDTDKIAQTIEEQLAGRLHYAIDDLSLCHGLGGAVAALLVLGHRDVPTALAHAAVDRYGERGDWPCGLYGVTPGLFRGLSGIGWLFLALDDPRVRSPLGFAPPG